MLKAYIEERIKELKGNVGIYYKNLVTSECIEINSYGEFNAASVIKIPILIEAFREIESGIISPKDTVVLKEEHKMPSCGALNEMHSGLEVTIEDMYNLMIVLSDNTATNILINILGIDNINNLIKGLDLKQTVLNRLLFDSKAEKNNYISPRDIGIILEKLWKRVIISPEASEQMEKILIKQKLNHKIPYLLPKGTVVAHKTGEDSGITHDVGIVFAKQPFILCFASSETDVVETEGAMRDIALKCYKNCEE